MKIEIKNLKVAEFLSEETLAYSATIYVDGIRAFDASNQGQGGPDRYYQFGTITESEVDAWVKANNVPIKFRDQELEYDLELLVGDLIARQQAEKKLKKLLKTKLVEHANGELYTYKATPSPESILLYRGKGRNIINGDPVLIAAALLELV